MRKIFCAAAVATAIISTAASPAVTPNVSFFNPSDGRGFVAAQEVQAALDLTKPEMQAQADSLSFVYKDRVNYDVDCIFFPPSLDHLMPFRYVLHETTNRQRGVNYKVLGERHIEGFDLDGFGEDAGSDPLPGCPSGIDQVGDPIETGSSGGELYVNGALLPVHDLP